MPPKGQRDLWWAFLQGRSETEWVPSKPLYGGKNAEKKESNVRAFADDESEFAPEKSSLAQKAKRLNEQQAELAAGIGLVTSLPMPSGTPPPSGSQNNLKNATEPDSKPREPTPSLLRHVDHRMSISLLRHFTHWINMEVQGSDISYTHLTDVHARWIFALLSRVHDCLMADDVSLLRNLARACLALIEKTLRSRALDLDLAGIPQELIPTMGGSACWIIVAAVAGHWGQRDIWREAETLLQGSSSIPPLIN